MESVTLCTCEMISVVTVRVGKTSWAKVLCLRNLTSSHFSLYTPVMWDHAPGADSMKGLRGIRTILPRTFQTRVRHTVSSLPSPEVSSTHWLPEVPPVTSDGEACELH